MSASRLSGTGGPEVAGPAGCNRGMFAMSMSSDRRPPDGLRRGLAGVALRLAKASFGRP